VAASLHGDTPYSGNSVTPVPVIPYTTSVDVNRFRNGAPLKDQVRSSLDSSHRTLRIGAVAVLGGIWEIEFCPTREIVFCGPAELERSPARVSREVRGSTARTGGLRQRCAGRAFNRSSSGGHTDMR
jgi:hypothetical protein